MRLKTKLFGNLYTFKDVNDVMARANEEKSGDQLAGVAASSVTEMIAAKEVLSNLDFSFQYFSSPYSHFGTLYYFSYEYGYTPIVQKSQTDGKMRNKVLIVQKQDFMNKPFDPWTSINKITPKS